MKTIQFEDEQQDAVHTRGEIGCEGCCCCGTVACELCDSGLVHCEGIAPLNKDDIGDEWANDGEWIHALRCDKCDYELLNEEEDLL